MSRQRTAKTALVTGASSGIGSVFARKLAQKGYAVTLLARREDRLRELVASLPTDSLRSPHRYLVADLSTSAGVQHIRDDLMASLPNLLVNNAGITLPGAFHESDWAKQQEMMQLNVDAPVALAHTFLKSAQSGDALINVASVLALLPNPMSATYSAGKAYMLSLSEALWAEQKPRGVYVMALCPGQTSTEIFAVSGGAVPSASRMQTPEEVVDEALLALRRRKSPTIITGRKNQLFVFAARTMSRKTVVSLMGGLKIEKPKDG